MAPPKRYNYCALNPQLTLTSMIRPLTGLGYSLANVCESFFEIGEWKKRPKEEEMAELFGAQFFETNIPKYSGGKVTYKLDFADLKESAGKAEYNHSIPFYDREIRSSFKKNIVKYESARFKKASAIVNAAIPVCLSSSS